MTPREELELLRRMAELEAKASGAVAAPKTPKEPDAFEKRIREEANAPGTFFENLGAGVNNVVQGVKQLTGNGETDDQIDERRALNDRAAGDSFGNRLIQGLGEMLPTMVIPGVGIGGAVASKALPRALGAAAEAAPGVATRIFSKKAMATGAGAGAGQAALNPIRSDESRVVPMAIGAAGGAVTPAIAHAGAAVYDRFSAKALPAATRAWNAIRDKIGAKEMGRIGDEVVSPTAATLPSMTTAAIADSAPAAALERGTRAGLPNVRNTVDLPRNQAAFERIMGNTVAPDVAPTLSKEATANVQAANQAMRDNVDPGLMLSATKKLEKDLARLTKSDEFAVSPVVQEAAARVEKALMDPNLNPTRLSLLVEDLHGLNEKAGAAFGPRITDLQNDVRNAVERATGGLQSLKQGVLRSDQQDVNAAIAAAKLRGEFVSPEGIPLGKRIGETPVITDQKLRETVGGLPDLDPAVRDEMNVVADALRRSELYLTQNSPGPSDLGLSAPLEILSTGSQNPLRWVPGVPGISKWTTGRANDATTAVANRMLLHPEEWANIEASLQALRQLPAKHGAQAAQTFMNWPGQFLGTQLGE